jgi:hypothetical protein
MEMPPQVKEKVRTVLSWVSDVQAFERLFEMEREIGLTGRSAQFEPHLTQLLELGYIQKISRGKVKGFVKGFCVEKPKKRTLRTILDGRPLNRAQSPPPQCELPGLEQVLAAVREYSWGAELDGTGWFHQFGLTEGVAAYWTLRMGTERYAWQRMPMGWAHAVYIAQTVTSALASFDVGGCRILVYIDNVYVFANSKEELERVVDQFIQRCREVRAQFLITTPPTHSLEVLGMRVDLENKTVDLKEGTREHLREFAECVDSVWWGKGAGYKPSTVQVWELFGNITWASRVLGLRLCRYPRWLAWVSRRARQLSLHPTWWDRPCAIWESARRDLGRLVDELVQAKPRPLKSEGESRVILRTSSRRKTCFCASLCMVPSTAGGAWAGSAMWQHCSAPESCAGRS